MSNQLAMQSVGAGVAVAAGNPACEEQSPCPAATSARFVWIDSAGRGRNRYVLFRKTFTISGDVEAGATFNLFADTRYRLLVNGTTVGHGPARFFLGKCEYDTWNIGPLLRPGRNVIAVMVNSYGDSCFHAEASRGGLIAWGRLRQAAGTLSLATDATWRCLESPGHKPDTHRLSFALNAAEQLDTRALPRGWETPEFDDSDWPSVVPCADPRHWSSLHPRSIPLLDERLVRPRRRLGAWMARAAVGEDIYSLKLISESERNQGTRACVAVMTYIHSPRDQEIILGAWWGKYWMNGQALTPKMDTEVPFRQNFPATLKSGWNLFQVFEQKVTQEWWDFYLALPRSAGLKLSAEPSLTCPDVFLVGGLWEDALAAEADKVQWPLASCADLPAPLSWKRWPRHQNADCPVREHAWRQWEQLSGPAQTLAVEAASLTREIDDAALAVLYDFDAEVLGRAWLQFEAAPGTTLDISYSERLTPDGRCDVHRRFFVDIIERYTARGGRQTLQAMHPRGFRYMEILVSGDVRQFKLHDVGATRAAYPVQEIGAFECSDPTLNRIWQLGRATQYACMEDAYVDCPNRERGLYSGDILVQYFTNLACFGDHQLFRRCLELFLIAQGDSGLVPGGAHGLPPGRHADYSAILIQSLWLYWSRSGDDAFIRTMLPRIRRVLRGLEALLSGPDGLVDSTNLDAYIDLCHMDKSGVNCTLNCFLQRAFHDAAGLMRLVGDTAAAAHDEQLAARLAAAIRGSFWDEIRGVFTDRRRCDRPDAAPSVPANALAVLYHIADERQAERSVAWLAEAMRNNFRVAQPQRQEDCNVTSYFSFYALGALYGRGRTAEAERFIRTYWGRLLELGAWTAWEYFIDTNDSLCHAWSTAPTHYLSTQVLGIEFPEPGNPNKVRIAPHPGTLQWARGAYPHPGGPIQVSWELHHGQPIVQTRVPPGVTLVQ